MDGRKLMNTERIEPEVRVYYVEWRWPISEVSKLILAYQCLATSWIVMITYCRTLGIVYVGCSGRNIATMLAILLSRILAILFAVG
jgi:hypothetical protein